MQMKDFRAMNTTVVMALEGQGSSDEGLRATQAFIEECEQRFSRFLPTSELSKLNGAAGQWSEVSGDLLEMLQLSKAYYEETGGLFDPSVLPDLKRAGYDVSMDVIRARGERTVTEASRAPRSAFSDMEIDPVASKVRLPTGMEIDLGGIAKGWIVEHAAQRLKTYGTAAAVSAGGDIFFAGMPADGSKWQVVIEDPRDPSRSVTSLGVEEGAVVTSSISKRTWKQNGERRHHIIDPRTGEPAEADWLSVTAIAARADLAEVYAKACLIGGQQVTPRLLLQRPGVAIITVAPDGQVSATQNSREYINDHNQYVQQR